MKTSKRNERTVRHTFALLTALLLAPVHSLHAADGINQADQDATVQAYPPHENVVDVTKPPYLAKGDGVSDDSNALQNALNDQVGRHRVLFFPRGTYLVSRTLTWPKEWSGHQKWGFTKLRGQARDKTVIRLKDRTFIDPAKLQAIMRCGGFGSADWFHNYVENLTFDVGAENPGATALQFYSNNTGAVRTAASSPAWAAAILVWSCRTAT